MKIYSVMTKFDHVYILTLEKSHEWVTDYLKNTRATDFTIFENKNQYAMKKRDLMKMEYWEKQMETEKEIYFQFETTETAEDYISIKIIDVIE